MITSAVLSGCGGDSDNTTDSQQLGDTTLPTIINLDQIPASFQNQDSLTLTFSEPLDLSAFSIEISEHSLEDFELTWNDAFTQVEITPKQDWAYGNYTITINGTDLAGNALTTVTTAINAPDLQGPPVTSIDSEGKILTKSEPVIVSFSESVNTNTASVTLDRLGADQFTKTWNETNTQLTLTPISNWPGGANTLTLDVTDQTGNEFDAPYSAILNANLTFELMQSAESEIGLVQDGENTTNLFTEPYGNTVINDGALWVADYANSSVYKFNALPESSGAEPDETINSISTLNNGGVYYTIEFEGPQAPFVYNGQLIITDTNQSAVAIFDGIPKEGEDNRGIILGLPGKGTCSSEALLYPEATIVAGGKLLIADGSNNRVLIWNTVPTQSHTEPDLVLGQNSFDTCKERDDNQDGRRDSVTSARTLNHPSGIWSDGEKLAVLSEGRVLLWNTFPQENFASADVVLGQETMVEALDYEVETNAQTLLPYEGIASNGQQLFIANSERNRVLIWDTWPTENFQQADQLLGQSNFTLDAANDLNQDGTGNDDLGEFPNRATNVFSYPAGLSLADDNLIVSDFENRRVLIFKSL